MRNLKKFLALVLAMMMTLSLMVTVNAAPTANKTFSDSNKVEELFKEDLMVVNGMGVIQGFEDETFGPQRNVTRGQMAAIIYRLATGDATDTRNDIYSKYNKFNDVKDLDWFAGYIGYCADAGYILGYPDGSFKPFAEVTGYEALTMILRAMGYKEEGHNFKGSTWKAETASTATQRGMLAKINNTNYRDTLNLAATRELVAEMAFQGATKEMVQWTNAFGYQTTGMETGTPGQGDKNPSLGLLYYGLTKNTGVIVGNEVTGENKGITKIGFSLQSNVGVDGTHYTIDDTMAIRHKLIETSGDSTADADYYGSAYVYASDTTTSLAKGAGSAETIAVSNPLNVTLAFKWDSNLYQMNHAVDVWYDCRSNEFETCGSSRNVAEQFRFTTNLNTYAVFDDYAYTAVVALAGTDNALDEVSLQGGEGSKALYDAATNSREDKVTNNWKAPGFKVRKSAFNSGIDSSLTTIMNAAYFNYNFGAIAYDNYGQNAATANSAISPVLQNNGDDFDTTENTNDAWGLYLLISNSADKTLDVVIPLNLTMTKITQINNTIDPYSVGVLNGNERLANGTASGSSDNDYFDTWDQVASTNGEEYAVIAQDNLRNTPNRALDTKVAAIQITGTTGPNADARAAGLAGATISVGDSDYGFAKPYNNLIGDTDHTDESTYYYQLTENTQFKTAKVIYINPNNQDLTLEGGAILHQSIYAEAVDATFTTQMEGVHVSGTGYTKQLIEGNNYTFTLDEQGNYIYWTTPRDTGKFIYGTYIDFHSDVASSEFQYPLVYVNSDGQAKQRTNIKTATVWDDAKSGGAGYTQMKMGSYAYDLIHLPKRDSSNDLLAATSGYMKGYYIGYALNETTGEITRIGSNPIGGDQNTGFFQATADDFGSNVFTIDEAAETLGAVTVSDGTNNIEYFLTNNTQFYVVDGAGTNNQTVTPYKGLAGLRAGYDSVVINVATKAASGAASAPDSKLYDAGTYLLAAVETDDDNPTDSNTVAPWDMVYFDYGRKDYAQDYLGSAWEVKTVFLPREALTFNAKIDNALHFVGDKTLTNISVVQGKQITQFKMYDSTGAEKLVWVDGYIYDGTSSAWVIAQKDNVFYNLIDSGSKAVDGQPIYKVRPLTGNEPKAIIGEYFDAAGWDGTTLYRSTDLSTSTKAATPDNAPAIYKATTADAQIAYIDVSTAYTSPISADLYNVGGANVVNLAPRAYPGIKSGNTAAELATLNDAGSLTSNNGVEVSCVRSSSANTVSVVFVNYTLTPYVAP